MSGAAFSRVPSLGLVPGALLLLTLVGCKKDEEVTWTQFNAEDDSLEVQVGTSELLDAVLIDLHSSTGDLVVGWAQADPGGGPIGTEHAIAVNIDDEYQDLVDRVSVRITSDSRGEDEFDLDHDSADEGYWKTTLKTNGEADEVRTDSLTFRAWEADSGDTAG